MQLYECLEKQMSSHDTICSHLEKLNQEFVKCNIIKYKLKAVCEQISKIKENMAEIFAQMSNLEVLTIFYFSF